MSELTASYWLGEGRKCKLVIRAGDITKWHVNGRTDAIVNAANEGMLGGGGVDGCIHDAAGEELFKYCLELPVLGPSSRCPVGEAIVTPAFKLPVAKIIHTVGPNYDKIDNKTAATLLELAYRNALRLAREEGCEYIAFPAISCGIFGFPCRAAAEVALSVCKSDFQGFAEIHFVLFEPEVWQAWVRAAVKAKLERSVEEVEERKASRWLWSFSCLNRN